MDIIPENWIDDGKMKRIICHWSAGGHKASDLDRRHYHILVEDDGEVVRGFHSIAANENTGDGVYAAHTRGTNSGSIGVAVCCMAGAQESPFRPGQAPMTEKQWRVMAQVVAELCKAYRIPVGPTTVLGHGEVERLLGKKQNGKWDPLVLPWNPGQAKREVGDQFRALVNLLLEESGQAEAPSRVKATLNGLEVSDAVSANEESYLKIADLLGAMKWQLVGAEVNTAAFARPGEEGLVYLPHALLGGEELDPAAADDAVTARVLKEGYVSVATLAELLNLAVAFDAAKGVLEIGRPASPGGAPALAPVPKTIIIKSGDTLSQIAERYLGSAKKWRLLRRKDGTPFTEEQARKLKLGDVVMLPDAQPPVAPAATAAAKPAGDGAAAGDVAVDLDDLVNAAAPEIRSFARVSIPVILAECKGQGITDPAQIAYILATSEHESKCGKFMRELWGNPPTAAQRKYEGRADLKNTQRGDGFRYRGRGFVQVTGRGNYTTWKDILGLDIVGDPDIVAKDPKVAAKILVGGMRDGRFRPPHSLGKFIGEGEPNFFDAREMINGDKKIIDRGNTKSRGTRIAEIATQYLAALTPDPS